MNKMIKIFAYGSNMLVERMTAPNRVPSAQFLEAGQINFRRLAFRKRSRDGSGKCDIAKSKHESDVVYGILYDVAARDLKTLDRAEGCGAGYHRENVLVCVSPDKIVKAQTYVADADFIDEALRPYNWYLSLVVAGAEVDPKSWTGRIVNPKSEQRSQCQKNDASTVPSSKLRLVLKP